MLKWLENSKGLDECLFRAAKGACTADLKEADATENKKMP